MLTLSLKWGQFHGSDEKRDFEHQVCGFLWINRSEGCVISSTCQLIVSDQTMLALNAAYLKQTRCSFSRFLHFDLEVLKNLIFFGRTLFCFVLLFFVMKSLKFHALYFSCIILFLSCPPGSLFPPHSILYYFSIKKSMAHFLLQGQAQWVSPSSHAMSSP